ncbi:sugar kinase [Novosphingobium fuchskuhlense]|uniref:Bifunctional NAD(P)H-hydrate repair enzyme n=1 Tax=Novosphingobium fuchskuhlense TaxID=1117702 RepID=A0A117UUZ8_9SPHN|nr:bifunctional ADP-dependent NAD(P)H-hydrate dehydratase/NAD(P)H-hydrate epimerase [Novosphingobium fuchskuhlense]KUR71338.1 sugar kinase [Novosphingobium fuchskuhlense]
MKADRDHILGQVLDVAAMRAAEAALIDGGTPAQALMETAGRALGEWARRLGAGRPVTVLCGPGNNGGDGYVAARHLMEHGVAVTVIAARQPMTPEATAARALFAGEVGAPGAFPHGSLLLDCLFGSGLSRPLPDDVFFLLTGLAERHTLRIAADLPSGIEADSGAVLNPGLPACDVTVALGAWKHAHFAMPAAPLMGALRLVDIGVAAVPAAARVLGKPRIAPPAPDAHKYKRGLLGIVAGAMPGAALLSAEAAQRSGAGYVKLLAPSRPEGVPPSLVCDVTDLAALSDPRMAAILVGPGLGRSADAEARLAAALDADRPVVIDADALVLLRPESPGTAPRILTPHEGEMAALEAAFGLIATGTRRARAAALAEAAQAIVLLKGPDSLIAAPGGDVIVSPRASAWLSVAGSGDVLAGIIASRLAVHGDAFLAAHEGLWLHGEAARRCGPAFTAGDLAAATGYALSAALP